MNSKGKEDLWSHYYYKTMGESRVQNREMDGRVLTFLSFDDTIQINQMVNLYLKDSGGHY